MRIDELQPGWQVQKTMYCGSKYHSLIGTWDRPNIPTLHNIGIHGENLSIGILSMNRSSLTKRLMDSIAEQIPDFAGIFLIFDNGSTEDELKIIRAYAEAAPYRCQVVEGGRNYGVAGGRNRMMKAAKTDWVLSVDNDMIFTANPLPNAQRDIAALGVHFLNMPLLNNCNPNSGAIGGHLYVEPMQGGVNVGIGSALAVKDIQMNESNDGFLCTGVMGTAAIINCATFEMLGGFEENMFVGFEDTEFSMRVFQAGLKVGCCGMVAMSHNHVATTSDADADYEKVRFKKKLLKDSATFFERKHGITVWNQVVADWVDTRHKDLNINEGGTKIVRKRKIALVLDIADWAYDHIADQVIRYCKDRFEFVKLYTTDIENPVDIFVAARDCAVVHFFWRAPLHTLHTDYCTNRMKQLMETEDAFWEKYIRSKVVTTSVYDHLMLEGDDWTITKHLFVDENSPVDAYSISTKRLNDIYQRKPELRLRPSCVIPDGVDLKRFQPIGAEHFHDIQMRTIRFGWVGNSKWAVNDLKGINTIIKPAIEQLQADGYNVELYSSDRQGGMIPHYKMPEYYRQIDCYVCASLCEGTPNPVLEAMASGLPVISTDVGLIPQLFGEKQKQLVLSERSVDCMVRKMKLLLNNREKFAELGAENVQQIQKWDWSICARRFVPFWEKELEKKK